MATASDALDSHELQRHEDEVNPEECALEDEGEAASVDPVALARRESQSLFLFKKDDEMTPEDLEALAAERRVNQQLALKLADEERERRLSELQEREDEMEIVRQINIEYSITAAEEEKERRIREYEVAKVQEQIVRERRRSEATLAIEAERERRLAEAADQRTQDEQDRDQKKKMVVEAMEKERVRRLSSAEHIERMPSGEWRIAQSSTSDEHSPLTVSDPEVAAPKQEMQEECDDELKADFSEIPVVQSSSSKLLVDEHTEWRCFISSENPEEEKDKLIALRTSLEDDIAGVENPFQELVGDVRLLRFLRGSGMDASIAASRYREMLDVRKKYELDEIRKEISEKNMNPEDFPHYNKIIPHVPFVNAYDLADDEGNVLYFEMSGYADFRALAQDVSDDDFRMFFLYEMEYRSMRLDQLSRQREQIVRTVFVRDISGFSVMRFQPALLKRLPTLLSVATKCYPETMKQTIILHVPWIFHKVWSAIAGLLQESQRAKIHMQADSYAHLVSILNGRDQLPKLLGGKNQQLMIPQTGLLGRDSFVLLCEDGATQAEIKAGKVLQLPFRMSPNDTICWEYEVKAHDVEFGLNFRTQGEGGAHEESKVPKSRVAAGQTISGSFTASEEGTAVLMWDNSYSWARGKTVAYKANVVKATHDFSCLDISGNDCV